MFKPKTETKTEVTKLNLIHENQQTQLLVQIIINRLALLMVNRRKASRLKWGAFAILTFINITVGTVWIPNRLQISETWIRVDAIWDRIEKVIFLLVDASLNIYFIYLVRTRLISNGLTKYNTLFKINIGMVIVSISLDVSSNTACQGFRIQENSQPQRSS